MLLIWFLLALVYIEALFFVFGKPRYLTESPTSECQQKRISSYSILSENSQDGCVEPVGMYSTLRLSYGENTKPQENVNAEYKRMPCDSTSSTERQKTNHRIHNLPSKLYSKSIASMSLYKHRSFTRNNVSIPTLEKGPSLQKKSKASSIYSGTTQCTMTKKRLKKRSFEYLNTRAEMKKVLLSNLMKMDNLLRASSIRTTQEAPQDTESRARDGPSNHELEFHISNEKYKKLERVTSDAAKNVKKPTIINRKQRKTIRSNRKNSNEPTGYLMANFKHGVTEVMKSVAGNSKAKYKSFISPNYDSGNTVFVNPKISEISAQHRHEEIDIKNLKKFKPLRPDYEYSSYQKPPAYITEEAYADFDWYQTDDLYEVPTDWSKSPKNELGEEENSTVSMLNNIRYNSYHEVVSAKDINGAKKQIIVLGVQHTPFRDYDDHYQTNEQLLFSTQLTPKKVSSVKPEINQQNTTDSSMEDILYVVDISNLERKTTSKGKLQWITWVEPKKYSIDEIGFRHINIQNKSITTEVSYKISNGTGNESNLRDLTYDNAIPFYQTTRTKPTKLTSTFRESRSNTSWRPSVSISTKSKPKLRKMGIVHRITATRTKKSRKYKSRTQTTLSTGENETTSNRVSTSSIPFQTESRNLSDFSQLPQFHQITSSERDRPTFTTKSNTFSEPITEGPFETKLPPFMRKSKTTLKYVSDESSETNLPISTTKSDTFSYSISEDPFGTQESFETNVPNFTTKSDFKSDEPFETNLPILTTKSDRTSRYVTDESFETNLPISTIKSNATLGFITEVPFETVSHIITTKSNATSGFITGEYFETALASFKKESITEPNLLRISTLKTTWKVLFSTSKFMTHSGVRKAYTVNEVPLPTTEKTFPSFTSQTNSEEANNALTSVNESWPTAKSASIMIPTQESSQETENEESDTGAYDIERIHLYPSVEERNRWSFRNPCDDRTSSTDRSLASLSLIFITWMWVNTR